MPKKASRRGNDGRRKAKPVSDSPTGRTMTVHSRRERFNRAGMTFRSTVPTTVSETDIGTETFDRILDEPNLRCEMHEIASPPQG